jgi:hypothetical protein
MKVALPLLCTLLAVLCGCTLIPGPHGTAQFWGDYTNATLTDGPVAFHADSMVHSTAIRSHYQGVIGVGAIAGGTALGLQGGSAAYGAFTTSVTAAVNRHTNRTTPTPAPLRAP